MRSVTILVLAGLVALLSACAGQIAEYPEEKSYDRAELKRALTKGDFREKTAARKQLDTLEPAERLMVLKELLGEADPQTRLLAAAELTKLPEETWRPLLTELAQTDPDEEVREFAAAMVEEEDEDVE